MTTQKKRNPSIVIIGAGMTGILMTIKLQEMGITDITVLEKTDNVGGTWRENTYPGVACDVPAHLYTYQFERNPDWSHRYAHGDEIQQYFERVARKYGVMPQVRFNEAVTAANYANGRWTVETSQGNTFVADFVICATGILHHPAKPEINGLENYRGKLFHTAEWDHSVDLEGKRVGIIGTGSTAAQVISELPAAVGKLTVFQRTAQWVLPTPNREFGEKLKRKCRDNPLRIPFANLIYGTIFEQIFSKGVTGHKIPHAIMSFLCKRNLKKVKDPVLRNQLTPDYKVGCKRIIMSGTFYDAIQQPNVALETTGIKCFTENGIETVDGEVHELDAVIMATGFNPAAYMRPMNMVGKDGEDIDTHWKKKIQAYRSMFIPNYPNFLLMLGPNTPIGNFNVIQMSEVQTGYVLKLLERWRDGEFDEVAATPDALQRFNQYLKEGMGKTVWVSGCNSWYLDPDGDPLSWPYNWKQWVKEMAEPDMSDFETVCYPAVADGEPEQRTEEAA